MPKTRKVKIRAVRRRPSFVSVDSSDDLSTDDYSQLYKLPGTSCIKRSLQNLMPSSSEELLIDNGTELCGETIVPFEKKLENIIVFVDVQCNKLNRNTDVENFLKAMGGTISSTLDANVTHVVYHKGSQSTFRMAKIYNCIIVSLDWIEKLRHNILFPSLNRSYNKFLGLVSNEDISEICEISNTIIKEINSRNTYVIKEANLKKIRKQHWKYPPHRHLYKLKKNNERVICTQSIEEKAKRRTSLSSIKQKLIFRGLLPDQVVSTDGTNEPSNHNTSKLNESTSTGYATSEILTTGYQVLCPNYTVRNNSPPVVKYFDLNKPFVSYNLQKVAISTCNETLHDEVKKVITKLGRFNFHKRIHSDTTHVIAIAEDYTTFNLLIAIAKGCWVLKYDWVVDSNRENKWLPEKHYELVNLYPSIPENRIKYQIYGKKFPGKVFHGCKPFYIAERSPNKFLLQKLVELGGGAISTSVFRCWLIIGEHLNQTIPCVKAEWLCLCLASGTLEPIKNFVI